MGLMSFLIKKTDGRGLAVYVAPSGSSKSYVTKEKARVYRTRAEAEKNRCPDNEIIIHQNQKEPTSP